MVAATTARRLSSASLPTHCLHCLCSLPPPTVTLFPFPLYTYAMLGFPISDLSELGSVAMADWGALNWMQIIICLLVFVRADALYVGITYLTNAVAKGAVCLD